MQGADAGMSCRETRPLLPLFFDGELEAKQMRAVALHSTRCPTCETELRKLERVQEAVAGWIQRQVEDVDLSPVWTAVEADLARRTPPWWERAAAWWEERWSGRWRRLPVYAAAGAAAGLALWWAVARPPVGSAPTEVAAAPPVDNSAVLDSVESRTGSLALLSEPETNTLVLWVMEEPEAAAGAAGDWGGEP